MRIAVVTPYHREPQSVLDRCIDSVAKQTVKVEHILIADGFPQGRLDIQNLRHISLDGPHGDFGNTPRGIGLLLAASERYEAISLLDADNWYDADHIESCLAAASADTDYVIAQRRFCRPDGSELPVAEEPDHVDTNCYCFLPGSYSLLAHWALMPKRLACVGDRIFYRLLRERGMVSAETGKVTVNYQSMFAVHYQNEQRPAEAKDQVGAGLDAWRARLTGRTLEIASRMAGVKL